jgi:hypothetical protein
MIFASARARSRFWTLPESCHNSSGYREPSGENLTESPWPCFGPTLTYQKAQIQAGAADPGDGGRRFFVPVLLSSAREDNGHAATTTRRVTRYRAPWRVHVVHVLCPDCSWITGNPEVTAGLRKHTLEKGEPSCYCIEESTASRTTSCDVFGKVHRQRLLARFGFQITHQSLKRRLIRVMILPVAEVGNEILAYLARRIFPGVAVEALPIAQPLTPHQPDRKRHPPAFFHFAFARLRNFALLFRGPSAVLHVPSERPYGLTTSFSLARTCSSRYPMCVNRVTY